VISVIQQFGTYGAKCMKQLGIEMPDLGINMEGDLIPENAEGTTEKAPESEGTTTTPAPGDTNVESPV
jgi:hypothetical protein